MRQEPAEQAAACGIPLEVIRLPITLAKPSEIVTIRKITGPYRVRQHLAELGFVVGESVMVVSENGGAVILQVKGARVAIGKTMANRIIV
jgi:ferrous iron transport protein A